MRKINKKGTADLMDLIFTVIIGFFMFFFLWGVFNISVQGSQSKAVGDLAEFKVKTAAVNNLRVSSEQGVDLEEVDIDKAVEESKIISGRTITRCEDYFNENDCNADAAGVSTQGTYCVWHEGSCTWGRGG